MNMKKKTNKTGTKNNSDGGSKGGSPKNSRDRVRVICPHYELCPFGKLKPKNNRYRCFGLLIEVEPTAAKLAVEFKCSISGKLMPMVIQKKKIRHIKPDSEEHQALKKLLKPIKCTTCDHRILDVHLFTGAARIHIKCPRDSGQLMYAFGAMC